MRELIPDPNSIASRNSMCLSVIQNSRSCGSVRMGSDTPTRRLAVLSLNRSAAWVELCGG